MGLQLIVHGSIAQLGYKCRKVPVVSDISYLLGRTYGGTSRWAEPKTGTVTGR